VPFLRALEVVYDGCTIQIDVYFTLINKTEMTLFFHSYDRQTYNKKTNSLTNPVSSSRVIVSPFMKYRKHLLANEQQTWQQFLHRDSFL